MLQHTTGQTLDPFINILLSAVLIFLTCFVILGFLLGVLFHFRKWWFKTLRQMRKQMAIDVGTEDVDTSFLKPVAVGEMGTLQEGRLRRRGSLGRGVSATVVSFVWSRKRSASLSNLDLSQLAANTTTTAWKCQQCPGLRSFNTGARKPEESKVSKERSFSACRIAVST